MPITSDSTSSSQQGTDYCFYLSLLFFSCQVVSNSFAALWTVAHQALCPRDFPGKNTRVGCHFLSKGSSQPRSNSHLLCWQADSLPLSHQESPYASLQMTAKCCCTMRALRFAEWAEFLTLKLNSPGQLHFSSSSVSSLYCCPFSLSLVHLPLVKMLSSNVTSRKK